MQSGNTTRIRVSFVVIAYNEAGNIGRTLDGITALAGLESERYEVIVVNDGSHDGTVEVVGDRAARNPHIKLIDLPKNRGRGYARFTGIAAAHGEFIASIDADIILPANWLIRAEAALADHDAVGGTAVPDGDVAYVYQAARLVPRVVGHTTAVTGSNALYRRKIFDLVSFDPLLREGEDVALNKATARHGLSFKTVPGLFVEHIENKTLPDSLRWLFTTGTGATRQLLVYRQVRMPDLATGAFLASLGAGVLVGTLVSPLLGVVIPPAILLAVTVQHVRSRFETPLKRLPAVILAIGLDGAHLLAYFAGRIAGLATYRELLSPSDHRDRAFSAASPQELFRLPESKMGRIVAGDAVKYPLPVRLVNGLDLLWELISKVITKIFRYVGCFGLIRGPLLFLLSVTWPPARGMLCHATIPASKTKVLLRLGSSDIVVFNGIFRWQEYGWDLEMAPRTVIDGGAYIGLSAIYFAMRYPGVRVIAVEASEANFNLLVRNTSAFSNIEPLHAALWPQPGSLVLTDPGTGLWGLQVTDTGAQQSVAPRGNKSSDLVRAITIPEIIRDYHLDKIDLLKVDIEGSEKELFGAPAPWLDQVDAICIELHDWFKVGCSRVFFAAVKDFSVEAWRGENVLVARA